MEREKETNILTNKNTKRKKREKNEKTKFKNIFPKYLGTK